MINLFGLRWSWVPADVAQAAEVMSAVCMSSEGRSVCFLRGVFRLLRTAVHGRSSVDFFYHSIGFCILQKSFLCFMLF